LTGKTRSASKRTHIAQRVAKRKEVTPVPYEIVRNDITRMEVDAIVNTANPRPVVGSGTDHAIHKAAGPELLEARKKIGDIAVGQSVETPAFNLHAKYVLHTVSPAWKDGTYHEEELLRKAYEAALALALKLRCKSVAFPLMSAGSYGFPRDKALLIATQVISEFTLHHRMQIYLVIFNAKAFSLAGDMFSGLRSFVDDHYVEEQTKAEYGPNRRRRELEEMYWHQSEYGSPQADGAGKAGYVLPETVFGGKKERNQAFHPGMSLEEVMGQGVTSFREYLEELLKETGEKDSEVYKRASMSRQLFNKILNKKGYVPSKNTILQLAVGLKLDVKKTRTLLEKAGYALSRSSRTDMVVRYYIENRTYNITLINISLDQYGLPLLGNV